MSACLTAMNWSWSNPSASKTATLRVRMVSKRPWCFTLTSGARLSVSVPANVSGGSTPTPFAIRTARSWLMWLKKSSMSRWRISRLSTLPSSKCPALTRRSCSSGARLCQNIVAWPKKSLKLGLRSRTLWPSTRSAWWT